MYVKLMIVSGFKVLKPALGNNQFCIFGTLVNISFDDETKLKIGKSSELIISIKNLAQIIEINY